MFVYNDNNLCVSSRKFQYRQGGSKCQARDHSLFIHKPRDEFVDYFSEVKDTIWIDHPATPDNVRLKSES